jgi:F-type H+-transporting ATPase subunit b
VINISSQFAAETSGSSSGIGAFNLNLKAFIFQLVTFLIVLMVLRRWVFPKLTATLEARRQTLEESLIQAKKTEETLAKAEASAGEIIAKARAAADQALADAKKAAAGIIADGETAASQRAALIIKEAENRLADEREKLRQELRKELANLVADATEKIVEEKLDPQRDRSLIERVIKGVSG